MICKLGLHKFIDPQLENTCCNDLTEELELLAAAEPYKTFLTSYNS